MSKRSGINLCRSLWLAGLATTLGACGLLGGPGPEGQGSTPAMPGESQSPSVPSPELQARYDSLLARLRTSEAGDADHASAVQDLDAFSREHPDLSGPLLTLGLVRARAGDEAGARELFDRAAQVCSRCGPVWNEIGVLTVHQGHFAEAEEAYRRAIDLEPDYAAAHYNLAILYELYIPRPDLAVQNYEDYLQLGGDGQDVEKWLVDLRRRAGAMPKAARAEGGS
ncbi:MAG: tetratricopeptide repeat protein [Gammaproteobacteria bacterium]